MSSVILNTLLAKESLDMETARLLMNDIMKGKLSGEMIAALLVALRSKGETAEEVAGFAQAMRANAIRLTIDDANAVDGCGTGGDGAHTFNISTAAALVAAGAGITVAKHGNRSVSSKCGSADLLEATGGVIDQNPLVVQESINKIGFGFMFAPKFHPAMKHAGPIRKALGIRTVFNILGPLTNPASVRRQVIGVFEPSLLALMAEVGQLIGLHHLVVVHARDGLDEFSISAISDFMELRDGKISQGSVSPEELGLESRPSKSLAGGDAKTNLNILNAVFDGKKSAYRDAVLLNAGAMIYVAGRSKSIKDGAGLAAMAVDNRSAQRKLAEWIEFTAGKG